MEIFQTNALILALTGLATGAQGQPLRINIRSKKSISPLLLCSPMHRRGLWRHR